MPNNTVQQTITDYFAALRANDVDAWVGTFAEDAVSHDPVGAPPHEGHAGIRQFLTSVLTLFQEVGLTEDHVFICGDQAAVKWTGRGIDKSGRAVTFEGIDVFEMNPQGKIQTVRAYWNPRLGG
jgi:steroid Delta-isomerase